MTTANSPKPVELWTFQNFADRIPLNRRQFEALDAIPGIKFSPKGKTFYRACEVDRWILATMAPVTGGAA